MDELFYSEIFLLLIINLYNLPLIFDVVCYVPPVLCCSVMGLPVGGCAGVAHYFWCWSGLCVLRCYFSIE